MSRQPAVDWRGAALVVVAVALAMLEVAAFGSRFDQFRALIVAVIFLLAGMYWLKQQDRD